MQRKGFVSLRGKLMVMMAGITALAMVLMGGFLAKTSADFVLGTSMHKGVEIAKITASLVQSRMDEQGTSILNLMNSEVSRNQLAQYIKGAQVWETGDDYKYSDILSISVEYSQGGSRKMGAPILGEIMSTQSARGTSYTSLFIPRMGDVSLPGGIKIYQLDKSVTRSGLAETIPVYRYRITQGEGQEAFDLIMDIAGDSVDQVSNRIFIIIGVAVLVALGLVLVVSNFYASHITRPLSRLVRDMKGVVENDLVKGTKVRTNDEVGVLADEFNVMIDRLRVAQEAKVEREKAQHELNIAREVQQNLLPSSIPTIQITN